MASWICPLYPIALTEPAEGDSFTVSISDGSVDLKGLLKTVNAGLNLVFRPFNSPQFDQALGFQKSHFVLVRVIVERGHWGGLTHMSLKTGDCLTQLTLF